MTLNDLIRKANEMARQLSSGDVILTNYGMEIEDIIFEFHYPNTEIPIIEMQLKK